MTATASQKPSPAIPRWIVRTIWSVHRAAYTITGGRFGLRTPTDTRWGMLRLKTIGRRSGKQRIAILGYIEDGANLVIPAMNGWADPEPAWWLNLQSDPQAIVALPDGRRQVTARAAVGRSVIGCGGTWLTSGAPPTPTRTRLPGRAKHRSSSSSLRPTDRKRCNSRVRQVGHRAIDLRWARHQTVTNRSRTLGRLIRVARPTHRGAQNGGLLMRKLTALIFAGLLLIAMALPAAAKDFGTVYFDGQAYRTFGNPASVPAGTGTDPIVSFTNFDQGGVSAVGPGAGANGGRWQVWMATWTNLAEAELLTDFDDVIAAVDAGDLTLVRAPEADFRCPILPGEANGTS